MKFVSRALIGALTLGFLPTLLALPTWPSVSDAPKAVVPPEGELLIFVSTSMPRASLMNLYAEAAQDHVPLIFRGLSASTLPEMVASLKPWMNPTPEGGGIAIDPVAFETFQIKAVPAFVHAQKVPVCPPSLSCLPPVFDVVSGNITLDTALKTLGFHPKGREV